MINLMSKQSLLLCLLLFLLVTKFAFLPLYNWQQKELANTVLKVHRLKKSAMVIKKQAKSNEHYADLLTINNDFESIFFDFQASNVFELQQQQWLENVFDKYSINVSNIGWQAKVPVKKWDLIQYDVKLNFKGKTTDIQKLQVFIESQPHWIEIVWFNYRFDKKRKNNLGTINGGVLLRFYMRVSK